MSRPWSSPYSQSRERSWYCGSSMVITLQPIQRNELVLWLVHGHHVTANPEKGVGTMARPWSSRYSQSRERSWYYGSFMVITLQPIQRNELVIWLVHDHHVTANPDKRVGTVARPWSSRYRLSRETRWYYGSSMGMKLQPIGRYELVLWSCQCHQVAVMELVLHVL